jgi:hypothetical protein
VVMEEAENLEAIMGVRQEVVMVELVDKVAE